MKRRKKVKHRHRKKKPVQEANYIPTGEEVESAIRESKWCESHLTRFLEDTHKNILITYVKQRGYFEMLDNLGIIFEKVNPYLTYSNSDLSSLVVLSLFGRACGNFFAAVRLAASGQLTESYAQLRVCIENALYASYISSKPTLAKVWGDRHQSEEKRKKCRDSFKISSMIKNLQSQSPALAKRAKKEYNTCIDFGAHPNERSVIPNIQMSKNGPVKLHLLNTEPGFFGACLLAVVSMGLLVVEIFEKVYPNEFKEINVQQRIQTIQGQYTRIAPGVVSALKSSTLDMNKQG
ncbi:MAG: hypothetical protein WAV28_18905 [Sedimentisphaerales bacterium]|jgi:hypothetical protein